MRRRLAAVTLAMALGLPIGASPALAARGTTHPMWSPGSPGATGTDPSLPVSPIDPPQPQPIWIIRFPL